MTIQSIADLNKEQLKDFDCGNDELNRYLKEYALQNNKKNISRTFVLLDEGKAIGYYSLANAQIAFKELSEEMKKNLPKYPIPAIRIARLAVSQEKQRLGIGSVLLKDAFLKILNVSKLSAICFVIVDSKEEAENFYKSFGFIPLYDFSSTLILPVSTIEKAYSYAK